MKSSGAFQCLLVDEPPQSLKIEGCNVEARKLFFHSDYFSSFGLFLHHKYSSLNEIGDSTIVTCSGVSFALT